MDLQSYLAQQLGPGRHAVALHSTEGIPAWVCTVTRSGAVLFYPLPIFQSPKGQWLRTVRGDEVHTHDRRLSAQAVRQHFRELAKAKGIRTVWVGIDPESGKGSAP